MHETKFSLKISYSTHACLAQLDQHQTCKPVMVSVVSSNPTGGNFNFLRHFDANFVQKSDRNARFVLFTKTSSEIFLKHNSFLFVPSFVFVPTLHSSTVHCIVDLVPIPIVPIGLGVFLLGFLLANLQSIV